MATKRIQQRKIQDYDPWYARLRHYVDFLLKCSYREIRYVGTERIPKDGAVIYAPNHTNALMDALVVLAMDRQPKVFVARADIFKNPTLAKIFHFLKIMPIMRIRDGFNEVKKNNETIEKAAEVLRDKVPFCIFPEGQHLAKHSALPLSKGIFRIALQAQEQLHEVPLYIVPVSLHYGNFFRFRSTVLVQIGHPIPVKEFMEEHRALSPQEQINLLKDQLTLRMREVVSPIADDEHYDAIYEICAIAATPQVRALPATSKRRNNLEASFEAHKRTLKTIRTMREEQPDKAAELLRLSAEASELRRKKGISLGSVAVRYPFLSRLLKILIWLVTLPYSVSVSVLTLPINALVQWIFSKLKDRAFRNSVRYVAYLVLWPILLLVYAVVACVVLPSWWPVVAILLLLPAPIVAHDSWHLVRLGISDLRLLCCKSLRKRHQTIRKLVIHE